MHHFPLLSLVTFFVYGMAGFAEDAGPYRMEGIVTERESGKPIAGATVKVLIESERKVYDGVTDIEGKYAVAIPVGHAQAWGIQPPEGYSPAESFRPEPFATSPKQPVFSKDYEVVRGIAWKIAVRAGDDKVPAEKTFVGLYQSQGDRYIGANSALNDQSFAVLTVPMLGGKSEMSCGHRGGLIQAPKDMSLELEQDFDSAAVKSLDRDAEGVTNLIDSQGRHARVRGAEAILKDGVATIVVNVTLKKAADEGIIRG